MNPSPHGRLPNALGPLRSPSSAIPVRPVRSIVKSEPRGQVKRASPALLSRSASARERRWSVAKSHAIRRASMSSVTPGSVAPRAPASLAALRARVCDSERDVGAMKTSASLSAPATAAGGSAPSRGARVHDREHGLRPALRRRVAQRVADGARRVVDDDHHLIALADAQALVDDGRNGALELRHGG